MTIKAGEALVGIKRRGNQLRTTLAMSLYWRLDFIPSKTKHHERLDCHSQAEVRCRGW